MSNEAPAGSAVLDREVPHHDAWASEIDPASVPVIATFEGSTSPENRYILEQLGDLRGLRVLDMGCGAGEAAVYFALRGAHSVGVDCSPGMLGVAQQVAQRFGVEIETHTMDCMDLQFPAESFDVVYAANLMHHLDPDEGLRQMHRVLKKGGRACFWDPLKHNPVINVYRRMASKVRTDDEAPLDIAIVERVRSLFPTVSYETFWFSTLWLFLRFYLIERVHPNEQRYWKKIIVEEERLREQYLRLERIDDIFKRLPYVSRLAWNIAVVATK